jgi:leader peptidase (prepilin peptidase)/N-methyltransferase
MTNTKVATPYISVAASTIAAVAFACVLHQFALAFSLVFLVPAAIYDQRERILPDGLVLPGMGGALFIAALSGHSFAAAYGCGIGMLALSVMFWARPQSVGLGDVKLVGAIGAALGPAVMIATATASMIGVVMLLQRGADRKAGVAMGWPWVIGSLVAAAFGTFTPWHFLLP